MSRSESLKRYYQLHPRTNLTIEERRRNKSIRAKQRYHTQRDEILARHARWREDNPTAHKEYAAERNKKGLKILETRAGRPRPDLCEVCGDTPHRGRWNTMYFDHDHRTGRFRGWLCGPDNLILGLAKDDPVRLRKLADYLEQNT
jgi:hypothetical protein